VNLLKLTVAYDKVAFYFLFVVYVDDLIVELRQSGLGISGHLCHKETVSLTDRDGKRPDGMTQIPWRSGKLLVWDVTVVSTTAESYVAAATRGRGEVAEMAATRKCQKYSELSTVEAQ